MVGEGITLLISSFSNIRCQWKWVIWCLCLRVFCWWWINQPLETLLASFLPQIQPPTFFESSCSVKLEFFQIGKNGRNKNQIWPSQSQRVSLFSCIFDVKKRKLERKRQKTKAPANWTRRSSLRHTCSPLQRQQEEKMLPPSLRGQGCLRLAQRMSRGKEERTLCLFDPFIQPLMAVAWNSKLLPIHPGELTWGTFTWKKRWFLEASREKWVTESQPKERSKVAPGREPGSWEVLHKFIHSLEKMLSGCLLCALY